MSDQKALFNEPPSNRNHDFIDLFPGGVFPTGGIHILERGGSILLIKDYKWGQEISRAQHRIWECLTKYGTPDAPGNITIACVWGLGQKTSREWVVYDHEGEHPRAVGTVAEWRTWLFNWWQENKRRR